MDVYDQIKKDELTEDLQLIANICGLDPVRSLLRHYSGMSFYVSRLSRLDNFVKNYLNKNSEKSIKTMAKELGVTEVFLKKMQKNTIEEKKLNKFIQT